MIRPATIDDCEQIAEVHVRTWQAAYRGIVPDEVLDAMDVAERAERWRTNWKDHPGEQTWVSVDGGTVTGWLICGRSRDTDPGSTPGELYGIYVRPEGWSDGTGSALMSTALGWLSERFPASSLWTLEANRRARAFYEKHGWQADGATKRDDRGTYVLEEVRYRITH